MPDSLERTYRSLLRAIAEDPEGEVEFVFRRDASLPPVDDLSTDNAYFQVGDHFVGAESFRVDHLNLILGRETARSLGALILTAVVTGRSTTVRLSRAESRASSFRISIPTTNDKCPDVGLTQIATHYCYFARDRGKRAFELEHPNPNELPYFGYRRSDDGLLMSDVDREKRDVVELFGSLEGIARFGALLLDAGRKNASRDEFVLEGPPLDAWGVAPGSLYLSLWLPGSILWNDPNIKLMP